MGAYPCIPPSGRHLVVGQHRILSDRIQMASVHTFRKVQSAAEKREVARVLHAWRELRIISSEVADGIAATLRTLGGEAASRILDEASAPDDEDDEPYSMPTRATGPAPAAKGQPQPEPPTKRAKVASADPCAAAADSREDPGLGKEDNRRTGGEAL